MLKEFLTINRFYFYYLQAMTPFWGERIRSLIYRGRSGNSHFDILKTLFRLKGSNPHAMAIGSADLRYGPERACCCATKSG